MLIKTFNIQEIMQSDTMLLTDTICRICLTPCDDMISIFTIFEIGAECEFSSKSSKYTMIVDLLNHFTDIKIFEKFSNMVCAACVKSAYDACVFQTKIRNNELWLESNVSELKLKRSTGRKIKKNYLQTDDMQLIQTWLQAKSKLEANQSKNKILSKKSKNLNSPKRKSQNLSNLTTLATKRVKSSTRGDDLKEINDYVHIDKKKRRIETSISNLKLNKLQDTIIEISDEDLQKSEKKVQSNEKDEKMRNKIFELSDSDKSVIVQNKNKTGVTLTTKVKINKYQNTKTSALSENSKLNKNDLQISEISAENNKIRTLPSDISKIKLNKPQDTKFEISDDEVSQINSKFNQTNLKEGTISPIMEEVKKEENYSVCDSPDLSEENNETNADKTKQNVNLFPDCLKDHDYETVFCEICDSYFSNRFLYGEHCKTHVHSNLICKVCERILESSVSLKQHMKTHCEKQKNSVKYPFKMNIYQQKIYVCNLCNIEYNLVTNLKEHLRIYHAKEKKLCCNFCGEGFEKRFDLACHLATHTFLPYTCAHCLQESVHTGEKSFVCEFCGRQFRLKHGLRDHIKYVHNTEKKYACHICKNKYMNKSSLQIHVKIHTQKRSFSCRFCDRTFSKKMHCKYHENNHQGIKQFSCKICQLAFERPDALMRHMKIHNKTEKVIHSENPTSDPTTCS